MTDPFLSANALVTADGASLPLRTWIPKENPRAVLIALHGFNDYSNAFADAGDRWASQGILVYAYDQREFGANNDVGRWPGIDTLANDLSQAVHVISASHPGLPLYLIGESMGGSVVMLAVARGLSQIAGTILASPAVWGRETMNSFYSAALWVGAHTVPWVKVSGQRLGIKPSDNDPMLIALGEDPLVIHKTRIDTVYGMVNLMDAALKAAPSVRIPTLVLYGAHDQIIPKNATAKMVGRFTISPTVVVYPDGYHMLLRDLQGDVVLDDISAWIIRTDNPLPSGYDKGWRSFLGQ